MQHIRNSLEHIRNSLCIVDLETLDNYTNPRPNATVQLDHAIYGVATGV